MPVEEEVLAEELPEEEELSGQMENQEVLPSLEKELLRFASSRDPSVSELDDHLST